MYIIMHRILKCHTHHILSEVRSGTELGLYYHAYLPTYSTYFPSQLLIPTVFGGDFLRPINPRVRVVGIGHLGEGRDGMEVGRYIWSRVLPNRTPEVDRSEFGDPVIRHGSGMVVCRGSVR